MTIRFFAFLMLVVTCLATSARADNDKVYNNILKTQTINCGYADWAPFMVIDPNTHNVSGLMYDVWEVIGKKLGLKIVWKNFVGWGEVTEAVRAGKIDIFCTGVWPDAGRTKNMLLSRPVFYNPSYLFGRASDTRFDNNYKLLNSGDHTVVGQEGDVTAEILAVKFPNAKNANIPPMSMQSDMILNVVTGKGDVALLDVPYAEDYMKNNPGKLRQVKGEPVAIFPIDIPFAVGENQLKNMVDSSLNDMINDGTIASLIKKYQAKKTYAPEADVRIPVGK
jgi:polar amino acid transport system substrate-binding protein